MYRHLSIFVHYILPPKLPFVHEIQAVMHQLMNIPASQQFSFSSVMILVCTAVYMQLYKYFISFWLYYFRKMKVLILAIRGVGLVNLNMEVIRHTKGVNL
jgi:hypothetical protein